jgi:hypothetical protein
MFFHLFHAKNNYNQFIKKSRSTIVIWIYSYLTANCWVCGWVFHIMHWLPLSPFVGITNCQEFSWVLYMIFCLFLNFFFDVSNLCFQIIPPLHLLFWLVVVLLCDGVSDEKPQIDTGGYLFFKASHHTMWEQGKTDHFQWIHHSHIDNHVITYDSFVLLWPIPFNKPYFGRGCVRCQS